MGSVGGLYVLMKGNYLSGSNNGANTASSLSTARFALSICSQTSNNKFKGKPEQVCKTCDVL